MNDPYAKNFSTCSATGNSRAHREPQCVRRVGRAGRTALPMLVAVLLCCLVHPAPAAAAKKNKNYDRAMLINPFLGPEYARWLVGPVARIATEEEVEGFLALSEDAAAKDFVAAFWQRRQRPEGDYRKSLQEIFDERVAEADHQFTEDGFRGSRSDRGTLYVLYGPPEKVDYEVAPWYGGPPIEVWNYPKDAPEGLDGETPKKRYEFIEDEGRTVFYIKSYHDRKGRMKSRALPPTRPY